MLGTSTYLAPGGTFRSSEKQSKKTQCSVQCSEQQQPYSHHTSLRAISMETSLATTASQHRYGNARPRQTAPSTTDRPQPHAAPSKPRYGNYLHGSQRGFFSKGFLTHISLCPLIPLLHSSPAYTFLGPLCMCVGLGFFQDELIGKLIS